MKTKGYTSRLRRRPSWPLLAAIVLFHIAVFYGLARAFAPDFTSTVEREVVSAFTVTITAPPDPPPPENEPEPDEGAQGAPGEEAVPQPVTAPSPRIERKPEPRPRASSTGTANRSGAREAGDGTGAAGSGDGTGSGNRGGGQGGVAVTKPSVRSGSLNTASDFPVPPGGRETRFGKSVTVAFTVTTDGRARNCSVARSSVDAETTALVCGLVAEKIRFNPATDRSGNPVEARYGYRVDFRQR
ncbi:energy transducer TonB [uncultured Erythrobacter sp.]|uniref:energy transducer TonB n=1 Tax=uncultured Erythrobacter sp. TaxID=263913 RepID=UPI00262E31B5|nr:energy transducer TonB [uncultured Erythrobacter sp.]